MLPTAGTGQTGNSGLGIGFQGQANLLDVEVHALWASGSAGGGLIAENAVGKLLHMGTTFYGEWSDAFTYLDGEEAFISGVGNILGDDTSQIRVGYHSEHWGCYADNHLIMGWDNCSLTHREHQLLAEQPYALLQRTPASCTLVNFTGEEAAACSNNEGVLVLGVCV